MERYADAEPELLATHHIFEHTSGREGDRRSAAKRLVALYEAWGNDEQATAWRAKLAGETPK